MPYTPAPSSVTPSPSVLSSPCCEAVDDCYPLQLLLWLQRQAGAPGRVAQGVEEALEVV
ncbi:hypothetical protein [Zobellella iuensis]|uniref:Uncharacterized protein n=1 Tax=Zobellella iuensis TaxID=2803811 RepID=A0ABS1QTG5_9GAMM|nr:hypothetical protein [Zobellella iuensis]MBL1378154.1 hypothetical protein [Zobellella iuensis]